MLVSLVALICTLAFLSCIDSLLLATAGMVSSSCSRRGQHHHHPAGSGLCSAAHGRQGTLSTEEYGPDNFGDIMGARETYTRIPLSFSPVERIILTANGNLQRVLSAYYGKPINIVIKKCDLVQESSPSATVFDREVYLTVDGKVVCTATGKIWIFSERFSTAIREQRVGVGQLFRYFQVLPAFNLLAVGRQLPTASLSAEEEEEGDISCCLWREYELSCPDMHCRFLEKFPAGFLDFGSASDEKGATGSEDGDQVVQISSSSCDAEDCMELP